MREVRSEFHLLNLCDNIYNESVLLSNKKNVQNVFEVDEIGYTRKDTLKIDLPDPDKYGFK